MNKWDSKRIAFISILIAMSISFVIIGTRFAAISSFPNIKLSLAGLPIKIIGYTFGPLTGFIIGFITDVISFTFMPSFYFPVYSIALGVSGMFPGLVAISLNYFHKKFSKEEILRKLNIKKLLFNYELKKCLTNDDIDKIKINENKIKWINNKIDKISLWTNENAQQNYLLIVGLSILAIVLFSLITIVLVIPQSTIDNAFADKGILKLISNKYLFIFIISIGIAICMIALIVFKFKTKKESNYLEFTSIVVFVVLTEYVNIPIVAYADYKAIKIDFITSVIASLATSIFKIWFNVVIISFAIRIVVPLITKKTFNGYA